MIQVRPYQDGDSLEEITALLHRAYKELADMGLRFVATYQDIETTRQRIEEGLCFVALEDGRIVGTITLYLGGEGCETYERTGVAHFGQFGIDPEVQGKGIGRMLLQKAEQTAIANGFTEMALDTSEKATHLIDLYRRWGYEVVETVQWDVTNYRSVVMSKRLGLLEYS
jgi:GNAT superfamily N-acetyltransferase